MRKYFLIPLLLILYCTAATAQMPQLTIDGKTNNGVQLQALKIEVQVCGTVARTTWQMTFKNTTSKILEGTLNFPLKNGLSVSRYALDINGKMREAVPVDRSKGTEVFETIERRRVDPGLLEKVDGNTFRTRIYPINPNNTRTVLIGYEEELPLAGDAALHYYLPLNLKDTVTSFDLSLSVIQSATQPVFDSSLNEDLHFSSSNNQYNAAVHKINYVPGYGISFSIPKPADAAEVMLQEFENKYYYLINTRIQHTERKKILPVVVGLLWDASLSGTNSNTKKVIPLLDAYFKKLNTATIHFTSFSNTIKNSRTYTVQNGNWDALQKDIEAIQYDGATDFGNLNLKNITADEFILVSDGHQTLGNKTIQLSNKPVYCINSSVTADYSNLKFIAGKTAGAVIDLQNETTTEALKKLTMAPFRFLGIKQNDLAKENYPAMPVAVSDNFAVAGIADEAIAQIVLQFGYGTTVTYEKIISINSEKQLCENFDITKVFAQKKIAELDIRYNDNKQEIERLGKQFGIVTRNTSLIVLETINDYIQYQIEPPLELRDEYNRIMKQRHSEIITKKEDDLQSSLEMIATLKEWYNKMPVKKKITKTVTPASVTIQHPVTITPPAVVPAGPEGSYKIISGRITGKDGNPIPFANLKIKGSASGLSADATGAFTMRAKQGDIVEISGSGFSATELPVDTTALLNATLERNQDLKEVVVTTAWGTRLSASTIVNNQSISSNQLNAIRNVNLNTALEGKVAGLQVRGQSGVKSNSTGAILLHGANSVVEDSGLIYILDGARVSPGDFNAGEVEDVSILSGTTAAAIFGSRAANGVVVMTTKNFKPDSAYKKIQDRVDETDKANKIMKPAFDIETFDFIQALKQTEKVNRYVKYLELRKYYIGSPTYFFNVATYFLKTGDKVNGLTILTNLAELENGSYELYKMLGYKLKEAGEYEGELSAFKKVMKLRPSDPQSFRDCALAYLDLGKYQQALDLLYEGMTKSYSDDMDDMYDGIEEVFLTEINRIIALHKKDLNLKKIDRKIITAMPTDIRVVMNWNMNNTDIDLWVTDPHGEKCFYSHNATAIGGRISDDFTEGFGPEQFMLKKGVRGKYKIQIDYFNDTQVTIAGPTTVMAEIYLHYGTDKEEKKIVTLQMEKDKQGEVFIGEVEL